MSENNFSARLCSLDSELQNPSGQKESIKKDEVKISISENAISQKDKMTTHYSQRDIFNNLTVSQLLNDQKESSKENGKELSNHENSDDQQKKKYTGQNLGECERVIENISTENISNQDSNECIICFCPFNENDNYVIDKCKHHFHKSCLETWLNNASYCPICRVHIDEDRNNFPNYTGLEKSCDWETADNNEESFIRDHYSSFEGNQNPIIPILLSRGLLINQWLQTMNNIMRNSHGYDHDHVNEEKKEEIPCEHLRNSNYPRSILQPENDLELFIRNTFSSSHTRPSDFVLPSLLIEPVLIRRRIIITNPFLGEEKNEDFGINMDELD